jgi:branched-chain amino acid transport system ATP-binding protein
MLLELRDVSRNFGGLQAVAGFSMGVEEGQLAGLIGPNGAGKTTIFNLITGVLRPNKGMVAFNGHDITGKRPHRVAAAGIGRTFQQTPLFADFTTFDNIVASYNLHPKASFWHSFFNTSRYRQNEKKIIHDAGELLKLTGLEGARDELAKNLPYGYQKMVGIARALATKPILLMLDEPLSGLNADEIEFVLIILKRLRAEGITIVIIEHNMTILDVCDHVVAIDFGRKIADGSAAEIRACPEVITAYLGAEGVA